MVKPSANSRRQRGPKPWVGYLLSFLLGALLTFGGVTYLAREKPLSPEDFSQKVFLVDQIIQSQLYEIGIQKKNILLHRSSLKKEGGLVWEQSSLKVQVLPSLPFSLIEGNFKRSLSASENPFRFNLPKYQNPSIWRSRYWIELPISLPLSPHSHPL